MGEEALICSSVTHQSPLSDSESAEAVFKGGLTAQGQTNRTSHKDSPQGLFYLKHDTWLSSPPAIVFFFLISYLICSRLRRVTEVSQRLYSSKILNVIVNLYSPNHNVCLQ